MPKRSGFIYLFFLLGFTFISSNLHAQRIKTYVKVDSLQVGDIFTYSISSSMFSVNNEMVLPDSSDFPDYLQILDTKHYVRKPAGDSVVYTLQYFGLNDTLVQSLDVGMVNSSEETTYYATPPFPIYFKSVLPDTTADFKPYKPLFEFTNLQLLILLLAALIAIYSIWYWFSRRKPKPIAAELPKAVFTSTSFKNPINELETAVYELKSEGLQVLQEDPKLAYIKLTDAFRVYFERVYDFPAMEQTSNEILRKLKGLFTDHKTLGAIAKLLRDADMVKFARFKPDEAQWQDHLSDASDLVDLIKREDINRIDLLKKQHFEQEEKRKSAFERAQKEAEDAEKAEKKRRAEAAEKAEQAGGKE